MFPFKNQISKCAILLVLIYVSCGTVFADVVNRAADAGKIEYQRSCENCHGVSGKGDGPYAARLLIKPADITVLAKNNNGSIPIPSIMPIWGNRYRSESIFEFGPDNSQTFVRGRIFELLIYIDTLQVQ